MRRHLHHLVLAAAGFVYQRGVDLYRLSDWLDPDDETDTTEPEVAAMWVTSNPTTTINGNVTWTRSS